MVDDGGGFSLGQFDKVDVVAEVERFGSDVPFDGDAGRTRTLVSTGSK